jgi:hypothetical protein
MIWLKNHNVLFILQIFAIVTIPVLICTGAWAIKQNNPRYKPIENYTYNNNTLHFIGRPSSGGIAEGREEAVDLELPSDFNFTKSDKLEYEFEPSYESLNPEKPDIIKFFLNGKLIYDNNLKMITTFKFKKRDVTVIQVFRSKKG